MRRRQSGVRTPRVWTTWWRVHTQLLSFRLSVHWTCYLDKTFKRRFEWVVVILNRSSSKVLKKIRLTEDIGLSGKFLYGWQSIRLYSYKWIFSGRRAFLVRTSRGERWTKGDLSSPSRRFEDQWLSSWKINFRAKTFLPSMTQVKIIRVWSILPLSLRWTSVVSRFYHFLKVLSLVLSTSWSLNSGRDPVKTGSLTTVKVFLSDSSTSRLDVKTSWVPRSPFSKS